MTHLELFDKILEWEHKVGEYFPDYFMDGTVKDASWAFWLLGKGYIKHANLIIDEILKGEKCIDQELLYEVYPTSEPETGNYIPEIHDENYHKNIMLWSEFLTSTPYYLNLTLEFFEDN